LREEKDKERGRTEREPRESVAEAKKEESDLGFYVEKKIKIRPSDSEKPEDLVWIFYTIDRYEKVCHFNFVFMPVDRVITKIWMRRRGSTSL
jgi:hypothetical protein